MAASVEFLHFCQTTDMETMKIFGAKQNEAKQVILDMRCDS